MNKIVLGKSTLPNLKNIKSKVGSMINSNYKVPEDFQNFAPKHNSDKTQSHFHFLAWWGPGEDCEQAYSQTKAQD